jgi:hypothetical protein
METIEVRCTHEDGTVLVLTGNVRDDGLIDVEHPQYGWVRGLMRHGTKIEIDASVPAEDAADARKRTTRRA